MGNQITMTISYDGREYHLTDGADDVATSIPTLLASGGGLLTFVHTGGRAAIAISPGTPVALHYVETS